jgi:hypothetical protein
MMMMMMIAPWSLLDPCVPSIHPSIYPCTYTCREVSGLQPPDEDGDDSCEEGSTGNQLSTAYLARHSEYLEKLMGVRVENSKAALVKLLQEVVCTSCPDVPAADRCVK